MEDRNRRFSSSFQNTMNLDLPGIYNAATTFVDDNIAQGRGERTAIFYQDRKFTYQEVCEKVNRTGNALKELGVEIENRVMLALPDSPDFAFSSSRRLELRRLHLPILAWTRDTAYQHLVP